MPVAIELEAYEEDLTRIVEDISRTMLRLEAVPNIASPPASGALTATVQFVGEWMGALLLQCTPRQALVFTARLMPGLTPSLIDEDVRDTLGEIANMLAGNLKSVLPPGVTLSMPSVVEGSDYALHICGGNASKRWSFSSEAGVFWVTLVQMLERK